MFRRNDESEWSRFSKGTGKDDTTTEKQPMDIGSTDATAVDTPSGDTEAVASPPSLSSRPPSLDTNLSLARPSTAAVVQPIYSPDDIESTIGEHTLFDGTCRSENSLRIRGTAQGEIECSKAVFIEENAKVSAKVTAASITVAGEVNGELTCSGRVEIRPTGRVTGTINAGTLVMQEGAFFDGNLRMRQAGEPATTTSATTTS